MHGTVKMQRTAQFWMSRLLTMQFLLLNCLVRQLKLGGDEVVKVEEILPKLLAQKYRDACGILITVYTFLIFFYCLNPDLIFLIIAEIK